MNKNSKDPWMRLKKFIIWLGHVVIRPFYDFYYNNGFGKASILSYVLCANMVIYVYIATIWSKTDINPFSRVKTGQRFLELHFLWPSNTILIEEALPEFEILKGRVVTEQECKDISEKYENKYGKRLIVKDLNKWPEEKEEYKNKYKKDPPQPDIFYREFSITEELAKSFHNAILDYNKNDTDNIRPLGLSLLIVIAIAYIALLLSAKTNLAEVASPIIWGNLPIAHRRSELKKLIWRLPSWDNITARFQLFVMLPVGVGMFVALLTAGQALLDKILKPYSTGNTIAIVIFSLGITAVIFTYVYKFSVTDLSKTHAFIGALIASALWLIGRWLFTTYAAVSLIRNLRNFALIPISLTWFYYLCSIFLLGLHIACTLEYPHLSYTGRWWIMRDIALITHYTILSLWVRLEFLLRLATSWSEEEKPPFIGMRLQGDAAEEIARETNLPASFVRESISEMVALNPRVFHIEVHGKRQFVTLATPPEEVDVAPLLIHPGFSDYMIEEMDHYPTALFAKECLGPTIIGRTIYLSDIRNKYRHFLEALRQKEALVKVISK